MKRPAADASGVFHELQPQDFDVPFECWPQEDQVRGKKSYTIKQTDDSGECVVQVLLSTAAFYIKTCKDPLQLPAGPRTMAWRKHGGVASAWDLCKERVGWRSADLV